MPVKIKTKASVKSVLHKETPAEKYFRSRPRNRALLWIFVTLSAILFVLIVTDADFYFLGVGTNEEQLQEAEDRYLLELHAQIAALEGRIDATSTQEQEKPASPNFDQECYLDPQKEGPIDTYITYVDKTTSVSASIPYSFSWGTTNCPPVSINEVGFENPHVSFGPTVGSEGGEERAVNLTLKAATDASLIRKQISDDSDNSPIKQRTVNGMTVLSYRWNGIMGVDHWIAFGRNYTYELSSIGGWLTDAEAIKIIESLKVTK